MGQISELYSIIFFHNVNASEVMVHIKIFQSNLLSNQVNKKWSFNVSNSDFNDVKKLSSINSDDSRRVLHLNVDDYKVKLSELSLWELEVDEVSENNKHLMFNKSFLSCTNDGGKTVEFHIFETFILIKDDISNLMISFEQDFSDND